MFIAQQRLILFLLILLLGLVARASSEAEFAFSKPWLAFLQYQKQENYRSKNIYPRGFLAVSGSQSPLLELQKTIEILNSPDQIFFDSGQSSACVFLGRQALLEKHLGLQFPKRVCEDFEKWRSALDLKQLRILYAGPYINNPASMMGHTFLRLANPQKESTKQGLELLSYSAGYMANPDPTDSAITYMAKGITGGYGGFFQIAPYYLNTGIYNNSESRDIWEFALNFNQEELDLFLKLLWEIQFTQATPYYFFDENCSYRPLEIFEVVRPEISLTKNLKTIVLPLDAIRVLGEQGLLLNEEINFRASIVRQTDFLLSKMSFKERMGFYLSNENSSELVLDALILKYNLKNYKNKTVGSTKDRKKFDEVLAARAALKTVSPEISNKDLMLRTRGSPLASHASSWLALGGSVEEQQQKLELSYRMGAHSIDSLEAGYEFGSYIEYFGFDWGRQKSLVLGKIYSLNSVSSSSFNFSWKFASQSFQADGGLGLATEAGIGLSQSGFYLMPIAQALTTGVENGGIVTAFGNSFEAGLILPVGPHKVRLEKRQDSALLKFIYALNRNQSLILSGGELNAVRWTDLRLEQSF